MSPSREPNLCIEDMERACSSLERRLVAPEVGAVAIRPVMDEPTTVLPPPPVIPPVTPRASAAVLRPLTPAAISSVASDEIHRRPANDRRALGLLISAATAASAPCAWLKTVIGHSTGTRAQCAIGAR